MARFVPDAFLSPNTVYNLCRANPRLCFTFYGLGYFKNSPARQLLFKNIELILCFCFNKRRVIIVSFVHDGTANKDSQVSSVRRRERLICWLGWRRCH